MAKQEILTKFRGSGNANHIKKWIQQELPPLSWNLTMLHLTPMAIKLGFSFTKIDEHSEFDERVLLEINFFLVSYFNVALPIYKDHRIVAVPGME